jgi:hypothetical protein
MIFGRDQERSLRFYLDELGFWLVVDQRFESGGWWIEVAPPDGNASLSLALATPDSRAYTLIGRDTQINFITEDVNAKFYELGHRGVRFSFHHRNRNGAEPSRDLKMGTETPSGLPASMN